VVFAKKVIVPPPGPIRVIRGSAGIGKNATGHLPLGVAALLQNQTSATVQVITSDAACFEIGLSQVKKADGTVFKANGP